MLTYLIISNIVSWAFAALAMTALLLTRRNARHWHKRFTETRAELESIERHNSVTDSERSMFEWYRTETERLERKCRAICMGVRKLKGRGKWTCEGHPTHRF